ncbi:MAG: hypothetical protein PHY73_06590 [Candidatus Omnitrophica bacterium]|nr:hypothetical protein [Candidatus Omnitrophota bacterium]
MIERFKIEDESNFKIARKRKGVGEEVLAVSLKEKNSIFAAIAPGATWQGNRNFSKEEWMEITFRVLPNGSAGSPIGEYDLSAAAKAWRQATALAQKKDGGKSIVRQIGRLNDPKNKGFFQGKRELDGAVKQFFGSTATYSYFSGNNFLSAIESGTNKKLTFYNRDTLKPINYAEAKKAKTLHVIKVGDQSIALVVSSSTLRVGDKIKGDFAEAFERIYNVFDRRLPRKIIVDYGEGEDYSFDLGNKVFKLEDALDLVEGQEDITLFEMQFEGVIQAKIKSINFDNTEWEVVSVRTGRSSSVLDQNLAKIRFKIKTNLNNQFAIQDSIIRQVEEILGKPLGKIIFTSLDKKGLEQRFFYQPSETLEEIEFRYSWGTFRVIKPESSYSSWYVKKGAKPFAFPEKSTVPAKIIIPSFADDVPAKTVYEAAKKVVEEGGLIIQETKIGSLEGYPSSLGDEKFPDNVREFSFVVKEKGTIIFLKKDGFWNRTILGVKGFDEQVEFAQPTAFEATQQLRKQIIGLIDQGDVDFKDTEETGLEEKIENAGYEFKVIKDAKGLKEMFTPVSGQYIEIFDREDGEDIYKPENVIKILQSELEKSEIIDVYAHVVTAGEAKVIVFYAPEQASSDIKKKKLAIDLPAAKQHLDQLIELSAKEEIDLFEVAKLLRDDPIILKFAPREWLQMLKKEDIVSEDGQDILSSQVLFNIITSIIDAMSSKKRIDNQGNPVLNHVEPISFVHENKVPITRHARTLAKELYKEHKESPVGRDYLVFSYNQAERVLEDDPGVNRIAINVQAAKGYAQANLEGRNFETDPNNPLKFFYKLAGGIGQDYDPDQDMFKLIDDYNKKTGAIVQALCYVSNGWGYRNTDGSFEKVSIKDDIIPMIKEIHEKKGVKFFALSDTTGEANSKQTFEAFAELFDYFKKEIESGEIVFTYHGHTDSIQGILNVFAAIKAGVREIDVGLLNLGGSPTASASKGNVCAEDLIFILEALDVDSGVDLDSLIEGARSEIIKTINEKYFQDRISIVGDLSREARKNLDSHFIAGLTAKKILENASKLKISGYSTYVGVHDQVVRSVGPADKIVIKDRYGHIIPYQDFSEDDSDEAFEIVFRYKCGAAFSFRRPPSLSKNWVYEKETASSTLTKFKPYEQGLTGEFLSYVNENILTESNWRETEDSGEYYSEMETPAGSRIMFARELHKRVPWKVTYLDLKEQDIGELKNVPLLFPDIDTAEDLLELIKKVKINTNVIGDFIEEIEFEGSLQNKPLKDLDSFRILVFDRRIKKNPYAIEHPYLISAQKGEDGWDITIEKRFGEERERIIKTLVALMSGETNFVSNATLEPYTTEVVMSDGYATVKREPFFMMSNTDTEITRKIKGSDGKETTVFTALKVVQDSFPNIKTLAEFYKFIEEKFGYGATEEGSGLGYSLAFYAAKELSSSTLTINRQKVIEILAELIESDEIDTEILERYNPEQPMRKRQLKKRATLELGIEQKAEEIIRKNLQSELFLREVYLFAQDEFKGGYQEALEKAKSLIGLKGDKYDFIDYFKRQSNARGFHWIDSASYRSVDSLVDLTTENGSEIIFKQPDGDGSKWEFESFNVDEKDMRLLEKFPFWLSDILLVDINSADDFLEILKKVYLDGQSLGMETSDGKFIVQINKKGNNDFRILLKPRNRSLDTISGDYEILFSRDDNNGWNIKVLSPEVPAFEAKKFIMELNDPYFYVPRGQFYLSQLLGKRFFLAEDMLSSLQRLAGDIWQQYAVKVDSSESLSLELDPKEKIVEFEISGRKQETEHVVYRLSEKGFYLLFVELLENKENRHVARELFWSMAHQAHSGISDQELESIARKKLLELEGEGLQFKYGQLLNLKGKLVEVPFFLKKSFFDIFTDRSSFLYMITRLNGWVSNIEGEDSEDIVNIKIGDVGPHFDLPFTAFLIMIAEISDDPQGLKWVNRFLTEALKKVDNNDFKFIRNDDIKASSATPTGGIDLTEIYEDLNIKIDQSGSPLAIEFQNLNQIHIEGLMPVIINIVPILNLPVLLGFDRNLEKPTKSLAHADFEPMDRSRPFDYALKQ